MLKQYKSINNSMPLTGAGAQSGVLIYKVVLPSLNKMSDITYCDLDCRVPSAMGARTP